MLVSVSYQLDHSLDQNIQVLKTKKHFNQVDWKIIKNDLELTNLRERLQKYKDLKLIKEEDLQGVIVEKVDTLKQYNEKLSKAMQNKVE